MRLTILVLLGVSCIPAMAQCPIEPRAALTDSAGKHLTIRYYNPGPRVVRDVHFVVKNSEQGQENQLVIANFAAKAILFPRKEEKQIFSNPANVLANSGLEVEVRHVSFADRSTWTAPHENPCRAPLTQQ